MHKIPTSSSLNSSLLPASRTLVHAFQLRSTSCREAELCQVGDCCGHNIVIA
jgi:hypothetical protein